MSMLADPAARELVALWSNRLEGDRLTLPLPTAAREIFVQRRKVIHVAFSEKADLKPHIERMLGIWPYQKGSTASTYVYVLAQQVAAPVWAAVDAINRVLRGEIPKPEFKPTPGQLRGMAWHVARPFYVELQTIDRILKAGGPRDEKAHSLDQRREFAARMVREFKEGLTIQGNRTDSLRGYGPKLCKSSKDLDFPDF